MEQAGELAREAEIHPLIKKEFAHVHRVAQKATILQMCQLCNVQPSQLMEDKKGGKKYCTVAGTCQKKPGTLEGTRKSTPHTQNATGISVRSALIH
eukprot:2818202-Ditylum_brightwellii.AAC.1